MVRVIHENRGESMMADENEVSPSFTRGAAGRTDTRRSEPVASHRDTAPMAPIEAAETSVGQHKAWHKEDVERLLYEQAALIEDRDRLAADHERVIAERDGLVVERDRLVAELRALRGAKGQLPRTSGELRRWRLDRGFTQRDAAKHLGVGHTTLGLAESRAPEAPLGRALRRALERDAGVVRGSVRGAG